MNITLPDSVNINNVINWANSLGMKTMINKKEITFMPRLDSMPADYLDSGEGFYNRVAEKVGKERLSADEKDIAFPARLRASTAFHNNIGICHESHPVAIAAWNIAQQDCWSNACEDRLEEA